MQDGRLLFARFALPPNRLGLCGGPEWEDLLGYALEGRADPGLTALIRRFQAAYPYLCFLAERSGMPDPLDPRVVLAYWVGNDLTLRADACAFYRFLQERFLPRIPQHLHRYVLGQVPAGARPHHSFHVLEVSLRTGALPLQVPALDRCRVSVGRVLRVEGDRAEVLRRPLEMRGGRLVLGLPRAEEARAGWKGHPLVPDLRPGDRVALHWGWVCHRLTPQEARRLTALTLHHLRLANERLATL